jgi:hypothetical protein
MKAYGEVDDLGTSWRWVVSITPRPLYPRERAPGAHCIGGWVDRRAGLDDVEKRKFWPYRDSSPDLSVVQPVASRCTDCTIPAHRPGTITFVFCKARLRRKSRTLPPSSWAYLSNIKEECTQFWSRTSGMGGQKHVVNSRYLEHGKRKLFNMHSYIIFNSKISW